MVGRLDEHNWIVPRTYGMRLVQVQRKRRIDIWVNFTFDVKENKLEVTFVDESSSQNSCKGNLYTLKLFFFKLTLFYQLTQACVFAKLEIQYKLKATTAVLYLLVIRLEK